MQHLQHCENAKVKSQQHAEIFVDARKFCVIILFNAVSIFLINSEPSYNSSILCGLYIERIPLNYIFIYCRIQDIY